MGRLRHLTRRSLLPFVAAITLLAGCQTNPSTGRSQLILIPSAQIAAMGAEAKPQLVQEFGGEVESIELRRYVETVGAAVGRNVEPEFRDIQWDFTVLNSDVINAFALPGGHVFITRGLLQMFSNEAQVAAVLGHEVGHVTARHVDERVSQGLLAQLGLDLLQQMVESGSGQLLNLGAQLATQGTLLKFGRDQESEADSQGLKYMTAAGYDPRAMLDVLEVLKKASEGGGAPPEFLSTHPAPTTRLKRVQRLIEEEYGFALNDPAYGRYEARFSREAVPHLK